MYALSTICFLMFHMDVFGLGLVAEERITLSGAVR